MSKTRSLLVAFISSLSISTYAANIDSSEWDVIQPHQDIHHSDHDHSLDHSHDIYEHEKTYGIGNHIEEKDELSLSPDELDNLEDRLAAIEQQFQNYYQAMGVGKTGNYNIGQRCAKKAGRGCRIKEKLGIWRSNTAKQRCRKGRAKYSCHLVGKAADMKFSSSCNIEKIRKCARQAGAWTKYYGGGQMHIGPKSCSEARKLPMPKGCYSKSNKKHKKSKKKTKKRKKKRKSKKKKRNKRKKRKKRRR